MEHWGNNDEGKRLHFFSSRRTRVPCVLRGSRSRSRVVGIYNARNFLHRSCIHVSFRETAFLAQQFSFLYRVRAAFLSLSFSFFFFYYFSRCLSKEGRFERWLPFKSKNVAFETHVHRTMNSFSSERQPTARCLCLLAVSVSIDRSNYIARYSSASSIVLRPDQTQITYRRIDTSGQPQWRQPTIARAIILPGLPFM